MNRTSGISESEYEVMKILWDKHPLTANEIIEALPSSARWSPKTVRTLINRLLKKGAVGHEITGKSYLYHPILRKKDYVAEKSESFLNHLFDGSLMPMLAYFARSKKLTSEDIETLRSIVEKEAE